MKVLKRIIATLGVTEAFALSLLVLASPAHAVDNSPCGARWWHSGVGQYVQYCPDWAPNNQIPVFSTSWNTVGYIYAPGNDWYVCQAVGGTYNLGNYANDKWAWTMADGPGQGKKGLSWQTVPSQAAQPPPPRGVNAQGAPGAAERATRHIN